MRRHSNGAALLRMAVVALLVAGTAVPVLGQDFPINELHPLGPGGSVQIEVVQHSITIEVWNRNEVEVTGQYNAAFEEFDVESDAGSFSLEIDRRNVRGNGGGGTLTVRVPAGVELDVESVSGEVRVAGNFGPVSLESVSGSVTYVGDAPEVDLGSISGSVNYTGTTGEASLESVSASVFLQGNVGAVDAESVSGGITVTSGTPVREMDLETVSGGVSFTGSIAPGGEVAIESFSGRIELALDAATAARFELETLSGSLNVTLPGAQIQQRQARRFGLGESANFITGNGNGSVEASTLSGSIVIRAR